MAYIVYLLNIVQWLQAEEKVNNVNAGNEEDAGLFLTEDSAKQALGLLCRERAEKVLRNRTMKGQAHSLGAGLLLQYIRHLEVEGAQRAQLSETAVQPVIVTVGEILDRLQGCPVEVLPIAYGSKGKPYFENSTLHFSLSHSGDYVLCAVADEEIGADIQECKAGVKESLVKRVLCGAELEEWNTLAADAAQAQDYFYRKWTEKEARGKLTGDGILDELAEAKQHSRDICVENDFLLPGYCISVCRYSKIDN